MEWSFTFAEFLFNFQPEDFLKLGHFKGATLRGGFGYAFKKLVCIFKDRKFCDNCPVFSKCPYRIIFESRSENKEFFKIKEIPRPFVIEPPYTEKQIYTERETFPVKLILIGKSIEYFPYFFLSFSSLGETGLGPNRKKYSIKSVFQVYPQNILLYTENSEELKKPEVSPFTFKEKMSRKVSQITLNFISPTRIKINGRLISVPEFHHIIRALIHRITLLSFYWCDVKMEYDWKNLIEEATDIKITNLQDTGLKVNSAIKLHRIVTISADLIKRELGKLPSSYHKLVNDKLNELFSSTGMKGMLWTIYLIACAMVFGGLMEAIG